MLHKLSLSSTICLLALPTEQREQTSSEIQAKVIIKIACRKRLMKLNAYHHATPKFMSIRKTDLWGGYRHWRDKYRNNNSNEGSGTERQRKKDNLQVSGNFQTIQNIKAVTNSGVC